MKQNQTKQLVLTALFAAIIIIMASVPFLGYIPLGLMNATIIHIPVILGALFLGPKKGAFLGFLFGLTSLIKATFTPLPTSFVFSPFYTFEGMNGGINSLIVCFIPRILIGITSYYIFKLIVSVGKSKKGARSAGFIAAGLVGSLTNTLLVMYGIFFLFGENYTHAYEASGNVIATTLHALILSVIGTQGVPEAIVAAVIVLGVGQILARLFPLYGEN